MCFIALLLILSVQPSSEQAQVIKVKQTPFLTKVIQAIEFKETSLSWQIIPSHIQTSKHLTSLTETLGSGLCALDFNNDGWIDLFFIGGSGHTRYYGDKAWWHKEGGNRLLLNNKGKHFIDVTEQAGLQQRMWGMGCATADFNQDGLTDIIITGLGANYIYANQGNDAFIDVTKNSGIVADHWSTGASLGDFNNDGLLDIYISNYILYEKDAKIFERNRGFRLTDNVAFDTTLYDPEPNRLYLNKGNFTFEDITKNAGVSSSLGRSLGAKWFDLNNDNWLDLLVINDKSSPSQVFINQHDNSFIPGEEKFAPLEISGVHDLIIDDFNNNNEQEFFMSRGASRPPAHISQTTNNTAVAKNNLSTRYLDIAWSSNLAQAKLLPYTAWAAISEDFNNDGFLDIYTANGLTAPDIDSHFVSQAQQNSLFINQGNGDFAYQPATNDQQSSYSSRGAIAVDLNNDGSLEVIVNNNNDVWQIFENRSKNNNRWLGINLLTNHNAANIYGAKIKITTNKLTLNRTIQAKQSFLSQGDPRLHIGLGNSDEIKELVIYWRDGKQSSIKNLTTNQYITISETGDVIESKKVDIGKSESLALSISALNEQALINFAKVLMQVDAEKASKPLHLVWQKGSNTVKHLLLLHIKEHWHSDYLVMVKDALSLQDVNLRLLAVEILKNAELEASMVWLIAQLDDTHWQVQCAIADTFRLFFEEEEAVTHRKKLALSPLIKALDSDFAEVKICIADALAAAENSRAIQPLLTLTSKNEAEKVQNAAIRALGLIRDTSVTDHLITIVRDQQSPSSVIASALIALSRLNEPSLPALFEQAIDATGKEPLAKIKSYHVLSDLLTAVDGTVFQRKKIEQQLIKLNKNTFKNTAASINQDVIISALQVIEAGKLARQFQTVNAFINNENPQVQIQAIKTMAVLKTPKARHALEETLLALPLDTTLAIVNTLARSDLSFSAHYLELLIRKINKQFGKQYNKKFGKQLNKQRKEQDKAVEILVKLFSLLPNLSTQPLFDELISRDLSQRQYLEVLSLCANRDLPYLIENSNIFKEKTVAIQTAYIHCLFPESSASPQLFNNNQQLKKRLALNSALKALSDNQEAKHALIIKAAKSDAVIAKTNLSEAMVTETILKTNTSSLAVSHLEEALNILSSHKLSSAYQELLWGLLRDARQSNELRLLAASHLIALEETLVLNYLNKHILNNETD